MIYIYRRCPKAIRIQILRCPVCTMLTNICIKFTTQITQTGAVGICQRRRSVLFKTLEFSLNEIGIH